MHGQVRLCLDAIIVIAVSFRLLSAQFVRSVSFPSIFCRPRVEFRRRRDKDLLLLGVDWDGGLTARDLHYPT